MYSYRYRTRRWPRNRFGPPYSALVAETRKGIGVPPPDAASHQISPSTRSYRPLLRSSATLVARPLRTLLVVTFCLATRV